MNALLRATRERDSSAADWHRTPETRLLENNVNLLTMDMRFLGEECSVNETYREAVCCGVPIAVVHVL